MGYLDQARHRLNLTIRPNCLVHRLIFDGQPGYRRGTGKRRRDLHVEGDEIILSAGAIGSPQIMLLSGVGPASHLNDLGIPVVLDKAGVGQNCGTILPCGLPGAPERALIWTALSPGHSLPCATPPMTRTCATT